MHIYTGWLWGAGTDALSQTEQLSHLYPAVFVSVSYLSTVFITGNVLSGAQLKHKSQLIVIY